MNKAELRKRYGYDEKDFILIYIAEFIPRKNHRLLFDILPEMKHSIPQLKIIFCGKGKLLDYYEKLAAEKFMTSYVTFTGYTRAVADYCRLGDMHISASLQEGQGLNLVEAMACGMPLVASDIRGHRDVIVNFENGILCDLGNRQSFIDAVLILFKNKALRDEISVRNIKRAKLFSVSTAVERMAGIYESCVSDKLFAVCDIWGGVDYKEISCLLPSTWINLGAA